MLKIAAPFAFLALFGCNAMDPKTSPSADNVDADRYHEKSFSWDAKTPALAKATARQTRFATTEALTAAAAALDSNLVKPEVSDSLWKPIDYACDELDLALWNNYGTIRVGDSVVLDENILRSHCRYIGGDSDSVEAGLAKASSAYPPDEVDDRQYPYKMIGRSWSEFDLLVLKSTGGETQFKKHRERFWVTGWWDTDASRIGVRIQLLDCGQEGSLRTCKSGGSKSDWYKNDDYVSKRDLGAGAKLNASVSVENGVGIKNVKPMTFRISDAVISLHSVDHGGLKFRAISSSGIGSATELMNPPLLNDYVTW